MAENHEVIMDRSACVGCGLCVSDCVAGAIRIENGKAEKYLEKCISCGHCEAICPQHAICLSGFTDDTEEISEQTRLNPAELLKAIKTRRSIRQFTDRAVSADALAMILEAGRLAPTGGNRQNTGYIILGSRQAELEALSVELFRKWSRPVKPVLPFLKDRTFDDQFFFKGAPLVIAITGTAVNAALAAENMAFMAEAQGLGVLFSGYFTLCANRSRKIRRIMGLKAGEKVITSLVIGCPAVRYCRTARREEANVRVL